MMIKQFVGNKMYGSDGTMFDSMRALATYLQMGRTTVLDRVHKNGYVKKNDITYTPYPQKNVVYNLVGTNNGSLEEAKERVPSEMDEEYKQFLESKNLKTLPFEQYNFNFKVPSGGYRYAVALFSDAHIEEVVKSENVLGKNEYNVGIAKKRIEKYFVRLATCLREDKVNYLYFASLGDTISGFIHEELAQTNELSPLEATLTAQNMIYNGLVYVLNNTNVESIKFIGIVGNHGRTTKKIQHSNGYKLSYEWIMYQNIKNNCEQNGLNVEFLIPESEYALTETPDKRTFLFMHGYQVKSGGTGTICGIYPALRRHCMRLHETYHQDKVFLGHFHSCATIPEATVNGSVIGYNTFAMSNAFRCEEPMQMYEVYDSEIGMLLTRPIYCGLTEEEQNENR